MVPLVGDSTGLGIERVFGRFLKVTKLEGVGIPVQFSGVLFNFDEEQQRVPLGSELQLVILADEQFDSLGDDASIGHNPIGTLNGCHSLLRGIPSFAALAFWEVKVNAVLHRARIHSSSNRDVVHHALEVVAIAPGSHSPKVQFIAVQSGFIAIV